MNNKYKEALDEVLKYADICSNPKKYDGMYRIIPRSLIIGGADSNARTELINQFLNACKCNIIRVELYNYSEDEVIETICQAFKDAEKNTPALVVLENIHRLIDERESLRDSEVYRVIVHCMENRSDNVFVLGTVCDGEESNLPHTLIFYHDRLFDERIEIDAYTISETEIEIEKFMHWNHLDYDVDTEELALILQYARRGEISSILSKAAFYARYENRAVCRDDIITAYLRQWIMDPDCLNRNCTENYRKRAVHIAGHVTVAEILRPKSVVFASACSGCEYMDGKCDVTFPDDYCTSYQAHEDMIIYHLSGKAATEIVTGTTDLICDNDLEKAFEIVDDLVNEHCSLGFEVFTREGTSDEMVALKDRLVASEMAKYYERSKQIIIDNRSLYNCILDELMENKGITSWNIQKIRTNL